ncbi:MAG TPA: hypothetical protein VJN96_26280 [Vicinamibacterales bacterium]|nr:hypothetical protein [Vicinamibacterales bacterium]
MTTVPNVGARWPLSLRVAFRFAVCFYAITTLYLAIDYLVSLLPVSEGVAEAIDERGLFAAYDWATRLLFGSDIVYATTAGFIAYMSTALACAGLAAIVWSLIDRRRPSYPRAYRVLRIYLRYLLAAVALGYGAVKVLPSQFVPPSLVALVTPLGDFTRMRLLWHMMGTSTAYTVFTGLVEVTGGLLLLSQRTTPIGALVLAGAFVNVSMLNFGYEVGVQLNSTIYALMAFTLLAPDAGRLATAFLETRGKAPDSNPTRRRLSRVVKYAVIVLLVVMDARTAYLSRREMSRVPALYGIYDVVEFVRDGVPVPPGDQARWLRLILAERGTGAIQWTLGGRVDPYDVTEDTANRTVTLTARGREPRPFTLKYSRGSDDLLQVAGRIDDHQIQARLRAIDVTQMPLRRPRR